MVGMNATLTAAALGIGCWALGTYAKEPVPPERFRAEVAATRLETGAPALAAIDPIADRLAWARLALSQEPSGPIGARFEYSNSGYVVAAAMLEATTGEATPRTAC
jgi:CubicO group peptidase (beta-lactamase class C family)